ncbi:hypothetical protein LCM10_12800 [Rossellomorea aquimaris]|uniref:hypothetical protein n=1 Tax=Rossellomorea aquimaris TaxID=189382 RepID=UPI001CD396B2|nr:hypothetical protein [Rossellomorea aquimaris]MCA1055869.1 hypothetical protein [Rossellomorea aquimaris]
MYKIYSVKSLYKILIILLMMIVMGGCEEAKKVIEISGNVKSIGNHISVNGTTNLKKGSKLKVELRDIEINHVIEKHNVNVKEDGVFNVNFSRDDRGEDHKLVVNFYPHEQTEQIQKIYGAAGGLISEHSQGYVQYSKEGNDVSGIQMFDFIYKVEKGSVGQRTFLLDHFENPNAVSGEE